MMATKESNISIKNMHLENLQCLLCEDTVKCPKTLSCGHTFCSDCILGRLEENEEEVTCELCGLHTDKSDLESATYMTSLLEVVRKIEAAATAECMTCEKEVTATFSCNECDMFYCDDCKIVHDKISTTANHQSISLEDFYSINQFDTVKNQIRKCETHNCVLKFQCLGCDILVCKKCTKQRHKSHDVIDIDLLFNKTMSDFKCLYESCEKRFDDLEVAYENINALKEGLELSKDNCFEMVSEYEKLITEAVKSRMDVNREEVERKYREKIEFSKIQKSNIVMKKDALCKTVKTMVDISEFKNPALVLSTGRMLIRTLELLNDNVTDLEPTINQHMSILDTDADIFTSLQTVPDIIYMNSSFAANCKLISTGDAVTCGHVTKIDLLTYDIDRNAVTVGGADVIAVFKHHTGDHELEADITDNNDGSYEITASCDVVGKYSVHVFVFDQPIPDVPTVTAVQWVTPKQELSVHKGEHFNVIVQATDDFGEIIENTLEDISAELISPDGNVRKCVVYYSSDKCEVKPATYIDAKGLWKIIFRDPNDVIEVGIHVFEWNFDTDNVFRQRDQCVELNLSASTTGTSITPSENPMILITLVNPEGKDQSVEAVKMDGSLVYRLSFKCDVLGQWRVNASVFDCPLQPVIINTIEWVVDSVTLLTCEEEFKFRIWARDVHGNAVEEINAVIKPQAKSPTGEIVDLSIEQMHDDLYVTGRFKIVGLWSLIVTIDNQELPPMEINVITWKLEPNYSVLSIGEQFTGKFTAFDANQQIVSEARVNIEAFLDTVTGRHMFDVLDNSDGSYDITGQSFEIGIWKLQLQLNDDVTIMLDIQVVNWIVDVTSAILSTDQTFSVTLTAIDENGERVPNGRGDITPYLQNPNKMYRKTEIINLNNGSYEISGKCNLSGLWTLGIFVNGEPPSDFQVPIEVVKEGYVMTVETRGLWLNTISCVIAYLTWYTDDILLVCSETNEILMIRKTGEFVTRLCLEDDRKICCIYPCNNGKIVVLDKAKPEVLILSQFGKDVSSSFGDSELTSPSSLIVDRNADYIFVVDSAKHCVMKFSFSGELLKVIGLEKHNVRYLKHPWCAAISNEDNLLISDNENNIVQMYNTEGTFLKTFIESGRKDGSVVLPRGIVSVPNGDVLMACDHQVLLFDGNGRFMRRIVGDGIMNPFGIAVVSRVPRQIACFSANSSSFHLYNY